MLHHRQPNKPRSLHRQLSGRPSLSTTSGNQHVSLPSVLEHSLDEWLSRSNNNSSNNSVSSETSGDLSFYRNGNGNHFTQSTITATAATRLCTSSSTLSSSPPPLPPQPRPSASVPVTMHTDQLLSSSPRSHCPCCQLCQCQSWKKMSKVIRQLETETRLAAEIGQSLLQKNEAYLIESNHLKEQLKQCEDRKQELEISLDDTERLAQQLKHEKDKWMWQYEKSEKILNESVNDLENTNLKCIALTNDLQQTKLEMEKLELFKYKSHQSNTREDVLQSKLDDTMQELMISRKTELTLESKYKKLLAQYESLASTYQDLCKNPPTRKSSIKQIKSLLSDMSPTAIDIQQTSTDELVTFIKELLSTNNGLKSNLLDASIQLDDTRNEMNFLKGYYHNTTQSNDELVQKQPDRLTGNRHRTTITTIGDEKLDVDQFTIHSNDPRRHHSISSQSSANKESPPTPQTTSSTPVVHHHYHYYLRQRQQNARHGGKHFGENSSDIISAYCDDQNCLDSASNKKTTWMVASLHSDPFSLYLDDNMSNDNHHELQPRETIPENDLLTPLNNGDNIEHTQHHGNDDDNYRDYVPETVAANAINYDASDNPTLTLSPNSSAPTPTKVKATTAERNSIPNDHYTSPICKPNINDSTTTIKSTPYASLLGQAKSILQRLHSTDARVLNRRLQRAFDIGELNNMSNAIIQNIIGDVDTMDSRFFWLVPNENDADGDNIFVDEGDYAKNGSSFLVNEFFNIVRLLQELLREIGQQSITINHLQVAYVKKVEENETRVEKQIRKKYQSHISSSNKSDISNMNSNNSSKTPSLIYSTPISTPIFSTLFTAPSTEYIDINPVNWLSNFFTYDIDNAGSLKKKASTYQRPTTVSIPNDNINTATSNTTLYGTEGSRRKDRRLKRLNDDHINLKNPNIRQQQHQQRQRYHVDGFEYHNQMKLWPTFSLIMDEWKQTTIKHSFSSSLDREWLSDLR